MICSRPGKLRNDVFERRWISSLVEVVPSSEVSQTAKAAPRMARPAPRDTQADQLRNIHQVVSHDLPVGNYLQQQAGTRSSSRINNTSRPPIRKNAVPLLPPGAPHPADSRPTANHLRGCHKAYILSSPIPTHPPHTLRGASIRIRIRKAPGDSPILNISFPPGNV